MTKKPNVIFMLVDDLGIGDVSSFNPNGKINTNNIDALAKDGCRFTDSHATSAVCSPSRYSLLTGRYPWRSRLKFMVLPGDSDTLIERDRITMAHVFKEAGYNTACVGKWHLGLEWQLKDNPNPLDYDATEEEYKEMTLRTKDRMASTSKHPLVVGLDVDYSKPITYGPNQYGFDYFFGLPASLDQAPFVYVENDRVVEEPVELTGITHLDRRGPTQQQMWERGPKAPSYDHTKVLDDMNNKVLELIDKYSEEDKPFFIYYPTPAVHGPLIPNKEFEGKSGLNPYADVVLQVDDYVGQITRKLKEKGIYEDTIFIFTSDSGCSAVADYETLKKFGHDPSGGYRGKKFSVYEGGHRVPTVVTYPRLIKRDSVNDSLVSHADFIRTFADFLGVELPDEAAEDSVSNLPLWKNEREKVRDNAVFASSSGYLAIERNGWKLELCEDGGDTARVIKSAALNEPIDQSFELYNIYTDKTESNNVIDNHKELVQELKDELTKQLDEGRSTEGKPQKNYVPEGPWVQINWR